jgi:hypothetical protein
MRRAIAEWGLVVSLVVLVGLGLVWVDSLYLEYFQEPLYVGNDLFVRFADGWLCMFSELGDDWKPTELGPYPKAMSWVRRYKNWFFPGIQYHNRLYANGRTVWSVEVSPLLAAIVLLTIIAILWRIRRGVWLRRPSATP